MKSGISDILEADFDWWSCIKLRIDLKTGIPWFKEGQIWWANTGFNVGVESNGRGTDFLRPVLVLKRYNNLSFLAVPLTTSSKVNSFRIPIGIVAGKQASINISQLRCLDAKRLFKKIGHIDSNNLLELKRKASEMIFR